MKGEYQGENQDHHHHPINPNMFSKFQQQQQQTQTFHHQHQQPTFHHPFHIATTTTATVQTSEEADSHSHQTLSPTNTSNTPKTNPYKKESSSHDGATIEIVRRPRGRPPGSKNKPKPPIIITREPEPSMSPYVLELPPNIDIISTVYTFCHKRNIGLCIFNASGTVTNVTLHQPSSTPGATVTFHGRFDILSISATILPNKFNINSDMNLSGQSNFTISLSGPQGQVFGGMVEGALASAGTIFLIAATFNNPTYQRLPLDENGERHNNNNNSNMGVEGGGEGKRHRSPGGGSGDSVHAVAGGGGVMQTGMYSCNNLQNDGIWAPTPRQPPNY